MGGLNLETFLRLLRADVGAWFTLALIIGLLSIMTWTSWGSRKALRKCLVLSVFAHGGLVLYGSTTPAIRGLLRPSPRAVANQERIQKLEVVPLDDGPSGPEGSSGGTAPGGVSSWDRAPSAEHLALADPDLRSMRLELPDPPTIREDQPAPAPAEAEPETTAPAPSSPEDRDDSIVRGTPSVAPDTDGVPTEPVPVGNSGGPGPVFPGDDAMRRRERSVRDPGRAVAALPPLAPTRAGMGEVASRPIEPERRPTSPEPAPDPAVAEPDVAPPIPPRPSVEAPLAVANPDLRAGRRPVEVLDVPPEIASRITNRTSAMPVTPAVPRPDRTSSTPTRPPSGRRPIGDVPEVYRSRLDPDRSASALRSGASPASEQAVERALDWLARHQDNDGRWNGGTARYADGTNAKGEDSFTIHCPAGEVCYGECFYAEADTAMTGLALLAYLGAGYTHLDGKYKAVVTRGLEFLLQSQKDDGDLRGPSKAVGMYCHAMASLAVCEAYALTGDRRLRSAAERAVDFIVKARSADGMAWRYLPGDTRGSDTSILGWIVLVLKSAREVGITVPPNTTAGVLKWLDKVSGGEQGGLARYQPEAIARSRKDGEITPTMTAEAWICRQFLGVGGPGPASGEAADYLLATNPGRNPMNIYYWYYGTLSMYQQGGPSWDRWNAQVRDALVNRQRSQGHQAGSWDPDDTDYGARGGRIYETALATLTLEVYYRYLRLYDEPAANAPIAGDRAPASGARSPRTPR